MSGTAFDHRLVRDYLSELDAAMRGLPAAQARELKEQITAHLDDALGPDAGDQEVAAVLSRLGSPADLAAEARAVSDAPGPRLSPAGRPARWRLALVIAVPVVAAAALGALRISGEADAVAASGRDQHLARLDSAVVTLAGALEDERDLSAAYAARRPAGPGPAGPVPAALSRARAVTDASARTVRADAARIGAGYPPAAVRAVADLLAGLTDVRAIRAGVASSTMPASQIIRIYTSVIDPAGTVGATVVDPRLQATATSLAALLRVENDQSVQRGILYAALSGHPPVLRSEELSSLQQAADDRNSDLAAFNSSASPAEQRLFASTVSGATVDIASSSEILAEQSAATHPSAPLTMNAWLNAASWYRNMSTAIDDTRTVTGRLAAELSSRAGALKSDAARNLLLTSAATLALLLVVLVSAGLARPLRR